MGQYYLKASWRIGNPRKATGKTQRRDNDQHNPRRDRLAGRCATNHCVWLRSTQFGCGHTSEYTGGGGCTLSRMYSTGHNTDQVVAWRFHSCHRIGFMHRRIRYYSSCSYSRRRGGTPNEAVNPSCVRYSIVAR